MPVQIVMWGFILTAIAALVFSYLYNCLETRRSVAKDFYKDNIFLKRTNGDHEKYIDMQFISFLPTSVKER